MPSLRTAAHTVATLATVALLSCTGDSAVTGPDASGVGETAFNATGQTAKLFISDAFGMVLLRYEVDDGGGAVSDGSIPLAGSARGISFSPAGELFVAHTGGGISRFLDPENAATANGSITAGNTGAPFGGEPQWSDFRDGELIQAQASGTVLRFTFDASGSASFIGTIAATANSRGLRVNPATNELFVSSLGGSVDRFLFDVAGNVSSNGTVTGGGLNGSHGVAFTPWGEMLVANFYGNNVSRFVFDASGNAVPNGLISGGDMSGPLDLDFSPWGELFVTNHGSNPGKVTRWVFTSEDVSASAVYNGSFSIPTNLGVLRFASSGTGNGRPLLSIDDDAIHVLTGELASNAGTVTDPEGDAVVLTASVGTVTDNGGGTWSWNLDTGAGAVSSQTVTISADDGNGPVAQLSFELFVNQFAPAMVFIGEAFGDRVFRYEVSDGGGATLDHTITTNINHPGGFAFSPSGELFVSNGTNLPSGSGFVSRYLDPEGAATPNGVIDGSTGAPFQNPQWVTFRDGELFLAQSNGVVLRFVFDAAGNAMFSGTISAGANTRGILASPTTGELLVSNLGNSIARFLFDAAGNAIPNGSITGGSMNHIHGMTLTPWGELLVANFFGNSISRFVFDAAGNAVPNGVISGGDMAGPLDLDISPWGELFVTNHQQIPGKVTRWLFTSEDASSSAVYNGSFTIQADLGHLRFVDAGSGGGGPVNVPPSVGADADPVAVDEGETASNTGAVSDGDGDVVTLTASVGTVTNNGNGTWSWSFDTTDGPAESQTVTIVADDGNGGVAQVTFELVVANVSPTVTSVSAPAEPLDIGNQQITVSATFTDPAGSADEAYTCTVDYGDGSGPQPGVVTSGSTCTGPQHTYTQPGVYSVTVVVSDKDGSSTAPIPAESFVVIYDPDGGFVTGGGWIDSAPGAYVADPLLAGKASFGFVSKYRKGATVPTGNTEFQFKAGDLNFHSSVYDWLVVNQGGTNAQFKGSGTINGSPAPTGADYLFMIWAGNGAADTFRIRIWYEDAGEVVVYDNGFDQVIGGGSIRIHQN